MLDPIQQQRLNTQFCGLFFNTPLVLLSGCVGFGKEYTRVDGFSNDDIGAICLKGTTLEPRLGNPPHRIAETAQGMLNAIGLQNPGARAVVNDYLPLLDFSETRFIANIAGSTIEEYAEVARIFDDSPIDAMEINVSCPNVKRGGIEFGDIPEQSARVIEACRKVTKKPLITKIAANQANIKTNVKHCIEAGTDGFAIINTIAGMEIDIHTRKPVLGSNQGGLSGPAIKPVALLKVHQSYQLCKKHNIPIIGQGGITTAEDAIAFLLAGASAIGIGTALFFDPLCCSEINNKLCAYLEKHQLNSVASLVGGLELH